jgi:hypothetical protein
MLSDTELRRRLTAATAHLTPDLEAELEKVFRRARMRRGLRWGGYVVGLAATVAAVLVLVGLRWSPPASEPDPVDTDVPAQALYNRGLFMDPAAVEPGRYLVRVNQPPAPESMYVAIDVPAGWGQDDVYSLATAAANDPTTRRLDFYGGVRRVQADACAWPLVRPGDSTLALAQALSSIAGVRTSEPEPVRLDDRPGYLVRVRAPTSQKALDDCLDGVYLLYAAVDRRLCHDAPGWTDLIWVVDVDGRRLVINASYGPEVAPAEVDELVRMVESVTFTDPLSEPD